MGRFRCHYLLIILYTDVQNVPCLNINFRNYSSGHLRCPLHCLSEGRVLSINFVQIFFLQVLFRALWHSFHVYIGHAWPNISDFFLFEWNYRFVVFKWSEPSRFRNAFSFLALACSVCFVLISCRFDFAAFLNVGNYVIGISMTSTYFCRRQLSESVI